MLDFHLGKDIKRGRRPRTLRLGQASRIARIQDGTGLIRAHGPERKAGRKTAKPIRRPAQDQAWVADARSSDTPGPIVELIDTFFM